MFNMFEELFAPGRKHTEDERNRLELVRDEEGDSDPGRGPIDLDSGTVVIRPATAPSSGLPDGSTGPARSAGSGGTDGTGGEEP
jgi:hypothetical protein